MPQTCFRRGSSPEQQPQPPAPEDADQDSACRGGKPGSGWGLGLWLAPGALRQGCLQLNLEVRKVAKLADGLLFLLTTRR